MGRPLKYGSALSHNIQIRLDEETYNKLMKLCKDKPIATTIREILKERLKECQK